jgi:hypothetical protein
MKIEFNGRVVAGFFFGAVCATAAFGGWYLASARPAIRKLVEEKAQLTGQVAIAEARADRMKDSAQMFAQNWVNVLKATGGTGAVSGCIDQFDSSTCFNVSYGDGSSSVVLAAAPSNPSGGPDPRLQAVVVAMYNRIHPGLGDAIKSLIEKQSASPR